MDPKVRDVLRRAHFEVHPQPFAIVGLPAAAESTVHSLGPWSAALQTGDEVTLYLPEAEWGRMAARFSHAKVQHGWRLVSVQVAIPWDLHGVLAALTGALGASGIPCAVLPAYTTDHLLVPDARLPEALAALRALRV
jgi:uncharacterized protein